MRLGALSIVVLMSVVPVVNGGCGGSDDSSEEPAASGGAGGQGGAAGASGQGGAAGGGGAQPECDVEKPTSCGPGKLCKAAGEGGAAKCVPGCLPEDATTCDMGQVCEQVQGGTPLCFAPVQIDGIVQTADGKPIEGARVAARDETGGVAGNVAVSGADGTYVLKLAATRAADGKPLSTIYTLRADASGYQPFPGALRPSIPIDLATATPPSGGMGPWVVKNAATTVVLFAGQSAGGLGTVRGVVKADKPGGTLIVAGGSTGVADASGEFAVFNVASGAQDVRGYAAGLNFAPASAQVPAGGEVKGVTLTASGQATATVNGNVNIVNAPGGSLTSVVLAVEDTFIASLEIGEVPRGLRADKVTGAFSIAGVPDGKYVVLASLDNDGLVRDPDPNIAGTQIVHLTVSGGSPSQNGFNFKVTEALEVKSPGATQVDTVSGSPTFVWADDSSEDGYDVVLFDSFGAMVWSKGNLPSVKGGKDVSVPYDGPALKSGLLYQFRGVSKKMGAPISRTEELRGVFLYK